jgi:hypothetical protein
MYLAHNFDLSMYKVHTFCLKYVTSMNLVHTLYILVLNACFLVHTLGLKCAPSTYLRVIKWYVPVRCSLPALLMSLIDKHGDGMCLYVPSPYRYMIVSLDLVWHFSPFLKVHPCTYWRFLSKYIEIILLFCCA